MSEGGIYQTTHTVLVLTLQYPMLLTHYSPMKIAPRGAFRLGQFNNKQGAQDGGGGGCTSHVLPFTFPSMVPCAPTITPYLSDTQCKSTQQMAEGVP